MSVRESSFGKLSSGQEVRLFTIENGNMSIAVCDYGATWVQALVPSRKGETRDVVLGYSDARGYERGGYFLGPTVGRFANRIGGAAFSIEGKTYRLDANDGANCLHGGKGSWNSRMWKSEILADGVRFSLESPDGDLGFPGKVQARATYRLSAKNEAILEWEATCDKPTPINMTNHAYFNLRGEGSGDILGHELTLKASRCLEIDDKTLPTGKVLPVKGGPMDFTSKKAIGKDIGGLPIGYDHCYVFDRANAQMAELGEAFDPESGRRMKLHATQPGVQLYTAFHLNEKNGKGGNAYGRFGAFCLETEDYPDAPNRPEFPNSILMPGKSYRHSAMYAFSW
jgi:aldose 1-epimerase